MAFVLGNPVVQNCEVAQFWTSTSAPVSMVLFGAQTVAVQDLVLV